MKWVDANGVVQDRIASIRESIHLFSNEPHSVVYFDQNGLVWRLGDSGDPDYIVPFIYYGAVYYTVPNCAGNAYMRDYFSPRVTFTIQGEGVGAPIRVRGDTTQRERVVFSSTRGSTGGCSNQNPALAVSGAVPVPPVTTASIPTGVFAPPLRPEIR